MTRDDTVIVCGDFGLWHDAPGEQWWFRWIEEKPFTLVFADGNHENFDRLYSNEFPVVDFHGGKAHKIRENLYHLMRGYIFDFEGKSFFVFGGAQSHDIQDGILDRSDFESDESFLNTVKSWNEKGKYFRINHISWWKQELPTQDEMDFGISTLKQHGNKVDFVISHCCPQEIASMNGYHTPDILTSYFDGIARQIKFDKWFFGHYHNNNTTYSKFVMLYENIERIL